MAFLPFCEVVENRETSLSPFLISADSPLLFYTRWGSFAYNCQLGAVHSYKVQEPQQPSSGGTALWLGKTFGVPWLVRNLWADLAVLLCWPVIGQEVSSMRWDNGLVDVLWGKILARDKQLQQLWYTEKELLRKQTLDIRDSLWSLSLSVCQV